MKMLLIHEDLWDAVEKVDEKDEKKSQKALARISLSVQPAAFPHIRNAKGAREAWLNLAKAYEDQGLCRRLSLLRQLYGTKLDECQNMESYLSKITGTAQQLQDINAPVDDEFVAIVMLGGLPPHYDPLIMALENSNIKLTSDVVSGKLLQESTRKNEKDQEGTALIARKGPKCFKCKKLGHYPKQCPKNNKKASRDETKALLTALATGLTKDIWCVDSGATNHMCNDRSVMCNFSAQKSISVSVANGEKLETAGHGDVKVQLKDCIRTLSNVYFVPNLSANLLSVSALVKKGYKVIFDKTRCYIRDGQDILATATLCNGVFKLDIVDSPLCLESSNMSYGAVTSSPNLARGAVSPATPVPEPACEAIVPAPTTETQEIWHKRLGHLNSRSMAQLKAGMVNGVDYKTDSFIPCNACIEGKLPRLPFPKKSYSRATQVLGLIHTDLCGPMSCASFSGAKYFLTFIDDYSRKTFIYFLQSKDQVFEYFKQFKALVENETGNKIKIVRSDNRGKYINKNMLT